MMRQLKQIIDTQISSSLSNQRCPSATDLITVCSKRQKKRLEMLEMENNDVVIKTERKFSQVDEYTFYLKLKMIGITRLLANQQLNTEKLQIKNANQILNELTGKIKIYQKESLKRENQKSGRIKELEIIIINLEAQIKSLQSDLMFSKRQNERNAKIAEKDVKKLQNKYHSQEKEKLLIENKLRSLHHVSDEQTKIIAQLSTKITQLKNSSKNLQNTIFEKDKDIAQLSNQINFQHAKHQQECQGLKKSLMKKAQENIKINEEINNLKDVTNGKENKIQQLRNKYNKLCSDYQKLQYNSQQITKQNTELKSQVEKTNEEFAKQLKKFKEQQQKIADFAIESNKKLIEQFSVLRQIGQRVERIRREQHELQNQFHLTINQMYVAMQQLSDHYSRQQKLLKSEHEIELKIAQKDLKDYIARLENDQWQDE